MIVTFTLPSPTPVNDLYMPRRGVKGGRTKSEAYTKWLDAAGWTVRAVLAREPAKFEGRYELHLAVPKNDPADVDARIKATLDLFPRLMVTGNDRLCTRVMAPRVEYVMLGTVRATLSDVVQ